MDELLEECGRNYCNVEFVFDWDSAGDPLYGCRLRPYGSRAPKNKMALGGGRTSLAALQEAVEKAAAGRWETLDWAARPWSVAEAGKKNDWY